MDVGNNLTITDKTIIFPSCLILLFIASPFLGVLYALYNLSKRQYTTISFTIVVGFAGLYGYTFLPYSNDDITRHYLIFNKLTTITSVSDLILYEALSFKPDFLIDVFYFIIGRFSDNHQLVGMLGSSMYYGLLLGVCDNWLNRYCTSDYRNAFWSLILCMLALIPTNEFCGMRQGNANALLLFFITWPKFYSFKKYIRIILIILPSLLHFSIFPLSLLYLLASSIDLKKTIRLTIILAICFLFVSPIMHSAISLLSKAGAMGIGISAKIDDYMFNGELDNLLYSGSRLRFYLIILLMSITPLMLNKMKKCMIENINSNTFIKFAYLTFGYVIFTAQTFVLSRTLMIYKFIICLFLCFLTYNKSVDVKTRNKYHLLVYIVIIGGMVFIIQAMEYRVVNMQLFTSSLPTILSITTDPDGYAI